MAGGVQNLFWDTNVFAALLYDEHATYDIPSIEQYLREAKAGQHRIHTSSVVFAEIASSKIKSRRYGSMDDLVKDFVGVVFVTDASVNVFQIAGRLKDIPYKKGRSDKRVLTTGDAVMLSSCIYIEDALGIKIDVFHTFDNAKKKYIPLLSYHEWCAGLTGAKAALAKRICDIKREKPVHPTPGLPMPAPAAP